MLVAADERAVPRLNQECRANERRENALALPGVKLPEALRLPASEAQARQLLVLEPNALQKAIE
jgi:hypothetical protein